MKVSVLLPAAGSGERLGRGPKALLEVGGRTLLDWALAAFAWADERLVALPAGFSLERPGVRFLEGGKTRQESVYNLLLEATGDLVLVHDVARPFPPRAVSQRVLEAVSQHGAATPVVPVPDTLIQERETLYGPSIPREHYRLVQTPQGFRRELLLEAHQRARVSGLEATDDAQLVLAMGHPVALVEGDRRAFKVTYADDLMLAEGLAKVWEET
ncbi:MAG TPA: 2-C-methyl-D-erythritol 4-phosphate cytidylyltransferase [Meiothermus sp.]|nr:2-C-methyl-D-erythritol 4-phosphate cytidylyltransferase [Meiothermus sp.]